MRQSLGELVLGLGGGGFGIASVFIKLHEFGEIELWLLEDLGLSDEAVVLEWEDL